MREGTSTPNSPKFDTLLCFTLYMANDAFMRAYATHLKPFGLTYRQYVVLMHMWQERSEKPADLARRLGIDRKILNAELDLMEEANLIRREGQDGSPVVLTKEAIALEGALYDVQQSISCEAFISDEALDFIKSELSAVIRRMNENTEDE